MHTVPDWLQTAFAEWITGRLYLDRRGNYRSRVPNRPRQVVAFNRPLKRAYPVHAEFHQAATRWLSLWELIPTARLSRTPSPKPVLTLVERGGAE
jgi:hypothetical protein